MKKVWNILFMILVLSLLSLSFTKTEEEQDQWKDWLGLKSALDSSKNHPRMIFIEFYTDWCTICKTFESKTLSKSRIKRSLKGDYYAVRFNAEQKDSIVFRDSVYTFDPTLGKGTHKLAYHLARNGKGIQYPAIVILNEKLEVVFK